jgi:catecholate siderophore receptor
MKESTSGLVASVFQGVNVRAWKGMGIEFRGAASCEPTPADESASDSLASPVTRKKRGSLLAMAALTLVGLTAQSADASPAAKDVKDSAENGKAPAPGSSNQATPAQTVHNFKIPAGALSEVLAALEKETGISFVLASDKIGALQSPGVTGVLSMQEALIHILANTGVSARFESPDRVALTVTGDNSTVEVHADAMPSPKYTAPLVDLPQTVTVISQETIQSTASSTLMEALRTVPGITFGAGEGGNPLGDRPFIRGMDAQSSTYIDGIRDIAAQSREIFDIESVEVQEGPGGAYGGRGTGGGSINMNSKMARRDNFIAGSFTPGTSNYKRGTIDANAKLNSLFSGRLTGVWHDADVAGRDAVHNNRWGVAPSLAIGLGGPTRAYLDYYHLVSNNMPDSGIPYNNPSAVPTNDPGERVLQPGDGSPLKVPHRSIFWGVTDRDHNDATAKVATGRVERDLWNGHALLRDSYRYERTETDYVWTLPDDSKGNIYYGLLFRRINDRVSAVFTSDNQTDLSGDFKTGKIKHSYATGMEFSSERGNNDAYNVSSSTDLSGGTESCPHGAGAASGYNCTDLFAPDYHDPWTAANILPLNHNPTHSKSVTQSVYGFDTIQFNSHFQSTVGGRYDHYDSTFTPAKSATAIPTQEVINNIGTYLASLIYKPDHATSIYGTVSTAAIPTGSSLAQGVDTSNLSTINNDLLQPEFIREEEFGAKRELSGGGSLVRIDFFHMDIQNVRITQADGTIAAAGTDRSLGAEASISGQVTKKWQLTGGYDYIDAILVNAGGAGAANGATNGQAMPNTARHSVSVTSNYRILPRLYAGGGIYGMTKVWGSQVNNKWVPGYVRGDIYANYQFNEHLNLQLNIQNVGNTYYFQQAYQTHYAIPGPGRTALFGLNMKW